MKTHLYTRGGVIPPEYKTWTNIRQRCSNPKHISYPLYGALGIRVCERWSKFENFIADMGKRPRGHSIDRIDTKGPYSPENCRWATQAQQQCNRRNNLLLTHNGKTMCAADWDREMGYVKYTITARLFRGWSTTRAIEQPVRKFKK